MSGLFKIPKAPKPIEPPKVPTIDEGMKSRIEANRLRRRKGRASTLLSDQDSPTDGGVGTSRLLGG